MPANTKPVSPFTPERHLDLQADLHFFVDTLFTGLTILDVGAGLGKSKGRLRHNQVTTYEPSEACRGLVDCQVWPSDQIFDVVTAFEVIEHVADDRAFLRDLERGARRAIVVTTPNWHVAHCQSAQHYREYTPEEFRRLLDAVFPAAQVRRWAYYKDAEGGWVDDVEDWDTHRGLKHVALIHLGGLTSEVARIDAMMTGRWRR